MLIELHCHTKRYSGCSHLDPADAVRAALAMGLQGLVITEHEHLWKPEELAELRRSAAVDERFVLLAAQEVNTELGHVLVFGADRSLPGRFELAALSARWPDAALVWAHPYRHGRRPADPKLTHGLLHAVEIFNSNHSGQDHYRAIADWHRLKFVATAGSDAHAAETVGRFPTQLDHPVATLDELVTELRAGRCRPFFKEIPRSGSNVTVTELVVGTKGADEHRQRIIVRQHTDDAAWEAQKRAVDVIEALAEAGFATGRHRVPIVLEVNPAERIIVEESQRGKSLFDLLTTVAPETAVDLLDLALGWLATLHAGPVRVGAIEATRAAETRRLDAYLRAFTRTRNPRRDEVAAHVERVREAEAALLASPGEGLCQAHGDFHPKNVIVGQDLMHDPATRYVSVIDFANSLLAPPALDLGYFRAQLRHQLRNHAAVAELLLAQDPVARYRAHLVEAGVEPPADLEPWTDLFELRGLLSIATFLVKVGLGESAEMDGLLARAAAL